MAVDLGTDRLPAISYDYEPPEFDLMRRKARDPKKDSLVTGRLVLYTYSVIGVVEAMAGSYTSF